MADKRLFTRAETDKVQFLSPPDARSMRPKQRTLAPAKYP